MNAVAKVGIVAAIGTVAIPSAIFGTRSANYASLVKSAHETLTKSGYHKKKPEKLADFNTGRELYEGGNYALGCHRILFGGKNVRKVRETGIGSSEVWITTEPMDGYLGDKNEPLMACSTASMMPGQSGGNVYDFELAVKRGDTGFLERVTVRGNKHATSQLTIYKRDVGEQDQKTWRTRYGIQRTSNGKDFEIGNPISKVWTDLQIVNSEVKKPKYFSVWIEDSNGQGMLDNLGLRFKPDKTIFSSVAKAKNDTEWAFKFFPGNGQGGLRTNANYNKNKATYNSKIANDVATFKGIWQDVNKFCESPKYGEDADIERLKNYCYTNQKNR